MFSKKAADMFLDGYNCSQAILGSFCVNYGFDPKTALRIACGLGSGARNAEICGAVSGAVLVIGLKYGDNKEICNEKTEKFTKVFKERNQHIVCKEILSCDISTPSGKEKAITDNLFKTVCLDMVISAADILEELGY